MQSKNQKGFTAIEIIIGFVVIALVGFAIYYVMNNKETNETTSKTVTSENEDDTKQNGAQETESNDTKKSVELTAWGVSIDLDPSLGIKLEAAGDKGYVAYGPDQPNGTKTLCGTIIRKKVPDPTQSYNAPESNSSKQIGEWLYVYDEYEDGTCPAGITVALTSGVAFLETRN